MLIATAIALRTEWQRMIEPITNEFAPDQALDQSQQDQQAQQDSLQAHFQPNVSADEIEQVYHLKRAQPLLQVFTALFHGGFDGVLVRLLVLRYGPGVVGKDVLNDLRLLLMLSNIG